MAKFIGDMLKKRRIEANLTQEQLAARLNVKVDERVIRKIENNEVKNSSYLKEICEVLNISFTESDSDEILSEHLSIKIPNVKTGRDLAHLLINCEHLDYHFGFIEQLDEKEEWIVEKFIGEIELSIGLLDELEYEDRQTLINILDQKVNYLNKEGFYIYGSCNDTLVNPFKYTELVFVKI